MWNQLKTILLLGILTGLLLAIGGILGGTTGITVALIIALVMNAVTYWFSDKLVLMMYGAKEAPKSQFLKLHTIVEDIAHKAGIPKPKVYIIPTPHPNAFATGRNPQHAVVACTEGILQLLTEIELKGVIAHEISHVKNRDILVTTIAATIAGAISYLAHMAQFAAIFGGGRDDDNNGNPVGWLVLAIVTPIAATVLQLAISRSREFLADETGARTIHNSAGLASALKKLASAGMQHPLRQGSTATASLFIVNPLRGEGLLSLFSTHPPLQERVRRLEALKV